MMQSYYINVQRDVAVLLIVEELEIYFRGY